MCAHCWLLTAWQRRVKCSGLSGVSGHWTGLLSYWQCHIIITAGRDNEAASQSVTVTAQCLVWVLTAEAHRLTGDSQHVVMWWSWQGEWRIITHCYCQSLQEVIASKHINDRLLPRSRRTVSQPCMFGCSADTICSSVAVNFITT